MSRGFAFRIGVLAWALGCVQPAAAATTGAYIDSPQGDWIGQGSEYTFGASSISATASTSGVVTITFDGWRAEFLKAGGGTLTVGNHENAQRYPFQGSMNPGLNVNSPGRGCNQISGWFRVHEVQITASSVMQLAVDFLQVCDGQPAMYGAIRINSNLGLYRDAPYARAPTPLRVEEGETAMLDATNSFARDSQLTAYRWVQTAGPTVTLSNGSSAIASFTAPSVAAGATETLVFRLTVTAANGLSDSTDVTVRDTDSAATRTHAMLDSAPGDWVGQGGHYAYDEDDSTITASLVSGGMNISIDGPEQWTLNLALPQGASWAPGMYGGAGRAAFRNPKKPGIDFYGEGRGCNTILGWFEVTEVTIISGQVRKLALDFVQNCEETNPPLFGAIRIGSSVPLERGVLYAVAGADTATTEGQPVWLDGSQSYTRGELPLQFSWTQVSGPAAEIVDPQAEFTAITPPENGGEMEFELTVSDGSGLVDTDRVRVTVVGRGQSQTYLLVDSPPGDYIGQGQLWLYTPDNSNITVSRNYDNGPEMRIDGDAWWTVDFAGPNEAALTTGSYENAQRFPFQEAGRPGLSWSGDGRGCNRLSGRFDVRAMVYLSNAIQAMAIDFEQSCEEFMPAARGELRYNIAPAALPTADAGPDRSVAEGQTVTLDGSRSSDDVGVIAYKWKQIEGPPVTLSGSTSAKPTFTAPIGWQTLAFHLDVADASAYHGFDTVLINVVPDTADSDGDGVRDVEDAFPNDPTESQDSDGDGYGDNSDAYPYDADEHLPQPDNDEDGIRDSQDTDDDDDGIPDSVETLAPGHDGNDDGTADSLQFAVRTFVDNSGALATLSAGAGVTFVSSGAVANPAPQAAPSGLAFERGFFAMEVELVPGGAGTVTLWLHGAQKPDAYWKHDATHGFYNFAFNGATGAERLDDRIVLHFVDGARGDSDGAANGRVVDPGAPAWGTQPADDPADPEDPDPPVGDTSAAGGSLSLGSLLLLLVAGRRRLQFRRATPSSLRRMG